MSKGLSYHYSGTKGHIVAVASSLPTNPSYLLKDGWVETTNPEQAKHSNSREFKEEDTGLRIRFDKGVQGRTGFAGIDHYHIRNPSATGNGNLYIDSEGNPIRKGHRKSHILPKGVCK